MAATSSSDFKPNPEDVWKIFDTLDAGIAIFNAGAERKLLYINPAMREITGGGKGGGIGWSLKDLIGRHGLLDADGNPVKLEEFPIVKAFEGVQMEDVPFEYIDEQGKHTWLLVTCKCIRNEDDSLKYVITTIRNIARRRSNENKLRFLVESAKILGITTDFKKRLREKAKLAVPSLADWCIIDILNDEGKLERVAMINRDPRMLALAAELSEKFPPAPTSPTNPLNVIMSKKPQFIPEFTEGLVRGAAKSPEHAEGILKLGFGSLMMIPIVSRGKGLGCMTLAYARSGRSFTIDDYEFFQEFCLHLGVLLDNAHLFDEIAKRDQAKDTFLASLSHELRNPLAPIKSALDLLRLKDVPADVSEEIDVIEHNFDYMARLLNDLLDVTRFTRGAIAIVPRPVDLREVIERALRSSDAALQESDITLHVTWSTSRIQILGDETRIEQAVRNLMSNAVKFTPRGGSIWVTLRQEGTEAAISVRDSGEGILPEDLPSIFELYYRGMNAKQAGTGLGIGLVLVDLITKLHHGTVEALSAGAGKGSEFILRFPMLERAEHLVPTPIARMPGTLPTGKTVRIIDDNVAAADALVKLLQKLGANASAVYSGTDALEDINVLDSDLILLDIGMPGMDGYETVRELRDRGATKPIIALTGYGMLEDKEKALSAGFDGHLTKPIGLSELSQLFEQVFTVKAA